MKNLFKLFAVAVLAVALAPLSAWATAGEDEVAFIGEDGVASLSLSVEGTQYAEGDDVAVFQLGEYYYIPQNTGDNAAWCEAYNEQTSYPATLPNRYYRLASFEDGAATLSDLTQYTKAGVAIVRYEIGSFASEDSGATWKHGGDPETYYIVTRESGTITNFCTQSEGFGPTYDSSFTLLNPVTGKYQQNIVYPGKEGLWFKTDVGSWDGTNEDTWYSYEGGYFVGNGGVKYNADGSNGGSVVKFWEDESNPDTWTNENGVAYLKAGDFYYNIVAAPPTNALSQFNADNVLVQLSQTEGVFTCAYTDIVNQVWREAGDTETEYTKKNVNGTVAFTANGDTVKKNADGTDLLQSGSFVYSAAVKKWFIEGDEVGYDKYGMYFSKDGSNYVNNAGTAVQITILDIVSTSFENILTAPIVKKAVTSGLTDDGVTQTAAAFTEKSYFYVSGTNDESYVTNAAPSFAAPVTRPDYFSTDGQTALLQLQTQGDTLYRTFAAVTNTLIDEQTQWTNGVSTVNVASKGTYLDMLVQLTPTDEAPEMSSLAADQKFAIWLQEFDDGENPATTNLCVYAGTLGTDGALGEPRTYTITTPDLNLTAGSWHRLTVKMKKLETGSKVLGFQLYLDSTRLTSSENALTDTDASVSSFEVADQKLITDKSIFPSLKGAETILNAVGFQGSGAVDDFAVTETSPEITKWSFTIAWNPELMTAVKWSIGGGAAVSPDNFASGSETIRVSDDDEISVSYVDLQYANGYGPGRWSVTGASANKVKKLVPFPAVSGASQVNDAQTGNYAASYTSGYSFIPLEDGARATLNATNLAEVTVSVSNLNKIALWWPQWKLNSDTGLTNTIAGAVATNITIKVPIDWIVDVRTNALTLRRNAEFHFAAGSDTSMEDLTDSWRAQGTLYANKSVGKRFVVDALLNPSFTVAGVITAYDFILNWDKTKLNAVAYTVNGAPAVLDFESGSVTNTYSCKGGAPIVTLTDGTTAKEWYVVAGFDVKAGTSVTNGHTMTLTSDTTADVLVVPAAASEVTGANETLKALIGTGMDASQFTKWAAEVAGKTVEEMNTVVNTDGTNLVEEAYLLNVGLLEQSTILSDSCSVAPRAVVDPLDSSKSNLVYDVTLKLNAKVLYKGEQNRTHIELGEETVKRINGRIVVRGWEIDDDAGTIRAKEAVIDGGSLSYDENGDAAISILNAQETLFQISIER